MEYFPAPLEKLVEQFARLPGIGGKSAQRLAFHILDLPESEAQEFAQAILDAKHNVTCCPECQNFTAETVPHLRLPQAGRQHHLRGGGSPGCGRSRAQPGVQRPLSRAPRRHLPHEPCGPG